MNHPPRTMLTVCALFAMGAAPAMANPATMGQERSSRIARINARPLPAISCMAAQKRMAARKVAGAQIVAIGANEGGTATDLSIGEQAHDSGIVALAASRTGKPLVLILSSYDPVIWDVRQVPRSRLRAIVVTGHYQSGVVGTRRALPVVFSSQKAPDPCWAPRHAYKGGPDLDSLERAVRSATGRGIDRFYGDYRPTAFHVDGGAAPAPGRAPQVDDVRAAAVVTRDAVPPKADGIAMLVRQGALRPATPADWAAVGRMMTKASPTGHLAPIRPSMARGGYVVLRAVALPRGMYGGHSATFIIPADVPPPRDPGSHNSFYHLKDGRCTGPSCGTS